MKSLLSQIWRDDEGVLTFEWILLITIIVIGIVGGVSAVRDAMISELGDVTGAALSIDQSYTVITDTCTGLGTAFSFDDPAVANNPPTSCNGAGSRQTAPIVNQGAVGTCIP